MAYLSEDKIASIVERVVSRLQDDNRESNKIYSKPASINKSFEYATSTSDTSDKKSYVSKPYKNAQGMRGVYSGVQNALKAAQKSFLELQSFGLEKRYQIIQAIRTESMKHVHYLSKAAVDETGLGRVDQKKIKNTLVIEKTPGPEILKPKAYSGDGGLTIEEYAPYGVIGAITPITNPTETIICNAIGMISAGNSVVFNCHPGAKNLSNYCVDMLNRAIENVGGPQNLLCCIESPTIGSAQELMKSPQARLLVVTGGPGVVKEAMNSGKKVIAAGPGNPPVVVDETADINLAADGIVKGVSLDNNIVCTAEKEILVVSSVADKLKKSLAFYGAYELKGDELTRVENLVLEKGRVNRKWVGKDASKILREVNIKAPRNTLIAYAEVSEDHPFVQLELLMPISALVRYRDVSEAIAGAVRCEHGNGHTAAMYSTNINNLHTMARVINTSIFTKNGPTYTGLGLGGEGFTSFTIASPTGEGLTTAVNFSRIRRCTLKDYFRIV